MRIFNDIYDLGSDMDPTVLTVLNALVVIHLCAFAVLIVIVMQNMFKSEQTAFIEKVHAIETKLQENKKNKKN